MGMVDGSMSIADRITTLEKVTENLLLWNINVVGGGAGGA